jgi:hypothetical protein
MIHNAKRKDEGAQCSEYKMAREDLESKEEQIRVMRSVLNKLTRT